MKNKKKNSANERFNRNGASDLRDNEAQNLKYNQQEDSFELDIESDDEEYQHEDPYDTVADAGEDMNSDYDQANPYVGDEYDKNLSLITDAEKLGMRITTDDYFQLDEFDAEIGKTPEDDREDLDDEGYPKFM
ncbi:hypothetical protein N9R54_04255 [Pelobium sp.]|nr:hypothetical protein [Pelobium sp.]MDA9555426.1 hypothetical protein [Pelobium sp.]